MFKNFICLIVYCSILGGHLKAGELIYTDSLPANNRINKKRLGIVLGTGASLYAGASIGLYALWYKQFDKTSFHWFDDSRGWMQIDKAGHIHSAYFESMLSINSFKWAGVESKKAALYGAGIGMLYQSTIEVFDGFSEKWGASYTDLLANTIGCALAFGQELRWKEQRIMIKYAFHPVSYDDPMLQSRSESLFGDKWYELFLKDYNGQSYWLSVNLSSFLPECKFPKWLNIAYGYSAENMFGGEQNKWIDNEVLVTRYDVPRYRQHFLSLDLDFTKIKTNSKILRSFLGILNIYKMPFAAISYDRINKLQFLPIYF